MWAVLVGVGFAAWSAVWAQAQAGPAQPTPPPQERPTAPQALPPPPAPTTQPSAEPTTGPTEDTGSPHALLLEPSKDFGEFWAGAELKHSFVIKNTGAKTLEITKVQASCGCTSTGYDKEIAPGEEGKVDVKVQTRNFSGKISKTVTVITNDPNNSSLRLTVSGTAKEYVTIDPRTVAFTQVQPDQVLNRTVKITNNSPEPLTLELDNSKDGIFTASLKELDTGKVFELEIIGHPPYQPRLNRATFFLKTNVAANPKLDIGCSAYVPPRLELRPPTVQLRTAQTKETKQTVRFVNSGKTEVKVTGVEVDDPNITAALTENIVGKDYGIELTFPTGYLPDDKGATVTIKTDDAEVPAMTLPISKAATRRPGEPRPGEKLIGQPAPKATLETVQGQKIAVGEPGEQILVLEFFASWDGFSKRSLPEVEKVHQKYKDKGVRFVAISEDERSGNRARAEDQIAQVFQDLNLTMERVLDPEQNVGKTFLVAPNNYPTLYLIGKNGVVESAYFGAKTDIVDLVSKNLDQMLAGQSPSASRTAVPPLPGPTPDTGTPAPGAPQGVPPPHLETPPPTQPVPDRAEE